MLLLKVWRMKRNCLGFLLGSLSLISISFASDESPLTMSPDALRQLSQIKEGTSALKKDVAAEKESRKKQEAATMAIGRNDKQEKKEEPQGQALAVAKGKRSCSENCYQNYEIRDWFYDRFYNGKYHSSSKSYLTPGKCEEAKDADKFCTKP